MLRTVDGVVFEVVLCREGAFRLVAQRVEPRGASCELINRRWQEVADCFEGRALARAHAVARLTPVQRSKLFGQKHRQLCWLFRVVGTKIVDPKVCELLKNETLPTLKAAAASSDPTAQLVIATRARMRNSKPRKREGQQDEQTRETSGEGDGA